MGRRSGRCDVANVRGVVTERPDVRARAAWERGVYQEVHGDSGGRKGMVLLAVDQFSRERERGPDIVSRDGVFPFHVFEAHPTCEAAYYDRDRRPRPADDGLTMANLWVDNDAGIHVLSLL